MAKIRLPNFQEAESRINSGDQTPIDEFVYWHEPAGRSDEDKFRKQLQRVIDYVAMSVKSAEKQPKETISATIYPNGVQDKGTMDYSAENKGK